MLWIQPKNDRNRQHWTSIDLEIGWDAWNVLMRSRHLCISCIAWPKRELQHVAVVARIYYIKSREMSVTYREGHSFCFLSIISLGVTITEYRIGLISTVNLPVKHTMKTIAKQYSSHFKLSLFDEHVNQGINFLAATGTNLWMESIHCIMLVYVNCLIAHSPPIQKISLLGSSGSTCTASSSTLGLSQNFWHKSYLCLLPQTKISSETTCFPFIHVYRLAECGYKNFFARRSFVVRAKSFIYAVFQSIKTLDQLFFITPVHLCFGLFATVSLPFATNVAIVQSFCNDKALIMISINLDFLIQIAYMLPNVDL